MDRKRDPLFQTASSKEEPKQMTQADEVAICAMPNVECPKCKCIVWEQSGFIMKRSTIEIGQLLNIPVLSCANCHELHPDFKKLQGGIITL